MNHIEFPSVTSLYDIHDLYIILINASSKKKQPNHLV